VIKHPLIRECLRFAGTTEHVEITSFADIPSTGSGLGSSSAFSVGLINALLSMQGPYAVARDVRSGRLRGRDRQARRARSASRTSTRQLTEGMSYLRFNADGSVHVDPIILDRPTRTALDDRLCCSSRA
jgi:D-glycero-alpha-D-manno-heptose-7-phosphate kinase